MVQIKAYIEVWERDKQGRFISYKRVKANSFVIAMLDILYVQSANTAQTIKDTGGTDRSVGSGAFAFRFTGGVGTDTLGIIVGSGTNAVTLADYQLQTKIAHGTGSGQLSYGAVSFDAPYTSGTSRIFRAMRTFTNNSGATVTVNEIGIYAYVTAGAFICMLDRSLLTFTITNGSSKTVRYTIQITV